MTDDLLTRAEDVCPRCLTTNDHSPDEKVCSDRCITGHLARIAELVAALRAQQWQPIDTAPKDGTEVVALVSGVPYFVRWTTHGKQHAEPWWRDREGYGLTEPTHWMPFPDPPADDFWVD